MSEDPKKNFPIKKVVPKKPTAKTPTPKKPTAKVPTVKKITAKTPTLTKTKVLTEKIPEEEDLVKTRSLYDLADEKTLFSLLQPFMTTKDLAVMSSVSKKGINLKKYASEKLYCWFRERYINIDDLTKGKRINFYFTIDLAKNSRVDYFDLYTYKKYNIYKYDTLLDNDISAKIVYEYPKKQSSTLVGTITKCNCLERLSKVIAIITDKLNEYRKLLHRLESSPNDAKLIGKKKVMEKYLETIIHAHVTYNHITRDEKLKVYDPPDFLCIKYYDDIMQLCDIFSEFKESKKECSFDTDSKMFKKHKKDTIKLLFDVRSNYFIKRWSINYLPPFPLVDYCANKRDNLLYCCSFADSFNRLDLLKTLPYTTEEEKKRYSFVENTGGDEKDRLQYRCKMCVSDPENGNKEIPRKQFWLKLNEFTTEMKEKRTPRCAYARKSYNKEIRVCGSYKVVSFGNKNHDPTPWDRCGYCIRKNGVILKGSLLKTVEIYKQIFGWKIEEEKEEE